MDDVFSGLDAAIEDIVFHNLFGKDGLLRTANLSVVVASSDGMFLLRYLAPTNGANYNQSAESPTLTR